jgi:hypothetical protein
VCRSAPAAPLIGSRDPADPTAFVSARPKLTNFVTRATTSRCT